MLNVVDAQEPTVISPLVTGILLLAAAPVFLLGFYYAVMRRARKDYLATKALLPTLRKGWWTSLWTTTKFILAVGVVVFILIAWVVRDFKDLNSRTPTVDISSTPAKR